MYLLDVIDGILPDQVYKIQNGIQRRIESYEEERRLFYVGITGAKSSECIYHEAAKSSDFCDELFGRKVLKSQWKYQREQPQ